MHVREEDHFENSSDFRGFHSSMTPAGGFDGRKPWGLDAKGADVDPESRCFEGEHIRRSPAEELVSKGYLFPHAKQERADGEEFAYESYRYRLRANNTIRLVAYEGHAAQVVIPEAVDEIRVTSLATHLFRDHDELHSASMPDSIEFVGNHVFDGCVNLRKVRLSAALAEVDPTMFLQCSALSEVTLSAPFVRLENNSFSDAPVACVNFGPQVQALDAKPLGLAGLEEVKVDAGNEYFVSDGKALLSADRQHLYRLVVPCTTYDVPRGCINIDERAFDSLSELEEVTLPESLLHIGRLAFAKTSLSAVQVPASVESIGEKAFYHCSKLTQVHLPRGLKHIDSEAFAFSAIQQFLLPAALEQVGFRAFEHTPAQARIAEGALRVSASNRHLDMDDQGGLYCHDVFVELIGQVERYRVRSGTRVIGEGAFRRHGRVCVVELPEGVLSLGREAFRGNRQLRRVDLPESLERIGERAFLDTALETLRLSKSVRIVGEDTLLVQGDNQLMPRTPLRSISLDAENPLYYIQSGLLCQRGSSKMGGDSCLLYVGPDEVVTIPEQVTHIANLAFCGAEGIEELFVHNHMKSICIGAFSTARSIPLIHVEFPEPIDGYSSGDFLVPELSVRYRSLSYLFDGGLAGTIFDFEYYDSWVTHTVSIEKFAPAAFHRLTHPMCLSEHSLELYENTFLRKSRPVCRYFAQRGNLEALMWLCDRGLLDATSISAELEASSREGRTQATACLLELQHRRQPSTGVDFSL